MLQHSDNSVANDRSCLSICRKTKSHRISINWSPELDEINKAAANVRNYQHLQGR